jgi:hypothetical protein
MRQTLSYATATVIVLATAVVVYSQQGTRGRDLQPGITPSYLELVLDETLADGRSVTVDALQDPALPAFEFHRVGAVSPDLAATTLFYGVAARSPHHFVRHLQLGVCDGPISTLQKFAECTHVTTFTRGGESFTVYDLPKGINVKKPMRVVGSQPFDPSDKRVGALQFEMMSTYGGENFRCIDVVGEDYDGLKYTTRVVVAQSKDRWFAIPRCRSSRSFYAIADSMGPILKRPAEAK